MDKILQLAIGLMLFSNLSFSQCDSIRTIQLDSCEYVALPTDLFVTFYLQKKLNLTYKSNLKILRNEIESLRLKSIDFEKSSVDLIDSILLVNSKLKRDVNFYSQSLAKANKNISSKSLKISKLRKNRYYYLSIGISLGIITTIILK